MFADFLDDSHWAHRSHRGWTTLLSFMMQVVLVSGLLLLPLLYTQALPQMQLMAALVAPTPPPAPAPAPRLHASPLSASDLLGHTMLTPKYIPKNIANLNESEVPVPELPAGYGVPNGTGAPGTRNPAWGAIGDGTNPLPPPPPSPSIRPPRISHMMEGNLIHRVQPQYPQLARQARIQGTVILQAVISREGKIQDLRVLSGHPLLVQAAMDAVRQWIYRPYYLNDQPVEVETQVTVNFTLAGG